MKRAVALFFMICLGLVFFSGCISSPGKRYYQLFLNTASNPPKIAKMLLVEPVDLEPIYDDYRLVYRVSPFELNYYSYEFWIKKPSPLLRDAIVDYYSKSLVFDKVTTTYAEGDPHLLLKTEITAMEENDHGAAWFAHLKGVFKVRDFKSGKTILRYSFDQLRQLPKRRVGTFPPALSYLLEKELETLATKLAEKISQ